MMAEGHSIPTSSDGHKEWINKQISQVALILSKLTDIDTKQTNMAWSLEDIMKKLDTLSGTNIEVKRDAIVAPDSERSVDTTNFDDNGDLLERKLKTVADLEERQTQIMLLLETMNQAVVRDTQEILKQVRQMNEKQVDLKKDIKDLRDKWPLLRANIFGISFLVVGTSAFIVFTTVIIARKINKINLYYRLSISSIVSDILKRNKTSVSTAEIVNKLRDILVTPVENLKPDVAP